MSAQPVLTATPLSGGPLAPLARRGHHLPELGERLLSSPPVRVGTLGVAPPVEVEEVHGGLEGGVVAREEVRVISSLTAPEETLGTIGTSRRGGDGDGEETTEVIFGPGFLASAGAGPSSIGGVSYQEAR
eukprot:CAMPEP_0196667020 /NCGR_PEP_ID=MMETSP1086-20130531/64848_1 /TAXON_ID=77921 /ORGANISM="Cyanoptyche  gloeocystis , Strain SAG4.97" /LENGTH=129 /DNA_ID=CAMNT_0042004299 /DNA_START=1927 /DNA_END=2317 /DNA_ORIENTATION=+